MGKKREEKLDFLECIINPSRGWFFCLPQKRFIHSSFWINYSIQTNVMQHMVEMGDTCVWFVEIQYSESLLFRLLRQDVFINISFLSFAPWPWVALICLGNTIMLAKLIHLSDKCHIGTVKNRNYSINFSKKIFYVRN